MSIKFLFLGTTVRSARTYEILSFTPSDTLTRLLQSFDSQIRKILR